MNKPLLLAAGSYRCGSTLVQRLLNTSEECHIWGEDNSFFPVMNNMLNICERSGTRSAQQHKLFDRTDRQGNCRHSPPLQGRNKKTAGKQFLQLSSGQSLQGENCRKK